MWEVCLKIVVWSPHALSLCAVPETHSTLFLVERLSLNLTRCYFMFLKSSSWQFESPVGAIPTWGVLGVDRTSLLGTGVRAWASCCMRCSMPWGGGTNIAGQTETTTSPYNTATSEMVWHTVMMDNLSTAEDNLIPLLRKCPILNLPCTVEIISYGLKMCTIVLCSPYWS